MSSQKDELRKLNEALEAAKRDPAVKPEVVATLEAAVRILAKHWPYSRTIEAALEAEDKINRQTRRR